MLPERSPFREQDPYAADLRLAKRNLQRDTPASPAPRFTCMSVIAGTIHGFVIQSSASYRRRVPVGLELAKLLIVIKTPAKPSF